MVNPEYIGKVLYSKILRRNFKVYDGPSDDFYKTIGLDEVLIKPISKEKKKKIDSDNEGIEQ